MECSSTSVPGCRNASVLHVCVIGQAAARPSRCTGASRPAKNDSALRETEALEGKELGPGLTQGLSCPHPLDPPFSALWVVLSSGPTPIPAPGWLPSRRPPPPSCSQRLKLPASCRPTAAPAQSNDPYPFLRPTAPTHVCAQRSGAGGQRGESGKQSCVPARQPQTFRLGGAPLCCPRSPASLLQTRGDLLAAAPDTCSSTLKKLVDPRNLSH